MKKRSCAGVGIIAAISLFFGYTSLVSPQSPSRVPTPAQKGKTMTSRAKGTFEVKLNLQDDKGEDQNLGRMTIDKQFHGDLEGTSKGQMLSARTAVKGSAGYVAIERLTGRLHGKSGTFVLQHSGTMTRGAPQLSITVVPDSGTGELTGLVGKMTIEIANGKHSYEFEYTAGENR
jgi:hypothetical protein